MAPVLALSIPKTVNVWTSGNRCERRRASANPRYGRGSRGRSLSSFSSARPAGIYPAWVEGADSPILALSSQLPRERARAARATQDRCLFEAWPCDMMELASAAWLPTPRRDGNCRSQSPSETSDIQQLATSPRPLLNRRPWLGKARNHCLCPCTPAGLGACRRVDRIPARHTHARFTRMYVPQE